MTTFYSDISQAHYGERQLFLRLQNLRVQELHIFNNLETIPNVKDLDALFVHPQFVIAFEIKAITIDMLNQIGMGQTDWHIQGRKNSNPIHQAYNASIDLRNFLKQRSINPPFMVASAIFSEIYSQDFLNKFSNPSNSYINLIVERCLFKEDFEKGHLWLLNKLQRIYYNPPIREGAKFAINNINNFIRNFSKQFESIKPNEATVTENQKLRAIESEVNADMQQNNLIKKSCIFKGYPGTGKTYRLQVTASYALRENKSVLYICFNKTLRTDIKRFYKFMENIFLQQGIEADFEIYDIYEKAKKSIQKIIAVPEDGSSEDNYQEWLELCYDDIKQNIHNQKKYDFILIDESQDMSELDFRFIKLFSKENTIFQIAYGDGQDIYNKKSDLDSIRSFFNIPDNKIITIKKNFRNTINQYTVAYSFYEFWNKPENYKVFDNYFAKYRIHKKKLELDFDRQSTSDVLFRSFAFDTIDFENFGAFLFENTVSQYKSIIEEFCNRKIIEEQAKPFSVLILVNNSDDYKVIMEAIKRYTYECRQKNYDISYIDYYDNSEIRRVVPQDNQIRICSYESSRGLEGELLLVFGLHKIDDMTEECTPLEQERYRKSAFIALSRGVFRTVIVSKLHPAKNYPSISLIQEIFSKIS